jgi:hypothetical protein
MYDSYADQIDDLRAKDPKITWREIAQRTGKRSSEQARSLYRREKKRTPQPLAEDELPNDYEDSMVEFLDKKSKENVNWRELIHLAIDNQSINDRLSNMQRIAEVHIKSNKPIGITFTGDWHLGCQSTNHTRWARDMEQFLETEGLFMIDLGDDRQNARNFRVLSVVLSQVLSPKQQAHLLRSVVDELTSKEKLLAKVDGNHDVEFDERVFGEALQGYLLERMKAPRFQNRGLLKLTVGEELYTILVFHKSRFSSFMRGTHGAFREHQLSFPADIVAGAHDHQPAFEILPAYQLAREADLGFGGMTYLVKVGTYQDSDFGWKYYHNGGKPLNPTIVLWPGEHRMQPFFNTEDAIRFLETFKEY